MGKAGNPGGPLLCKSEPLAAWISSGDSGSGAEVSSWVERKVKCPVLGMMPSNDKAGRVSPLTWETEVDSSREATRSKARRGDGAGEMEQGRSTERLVKPGLVAKVCNHSTWKLRQDQKFKVSLATK